MMRTDAPIAESNICMYSTVRDGYLLLPSAQCGRIFLELKEMGLLNAFWDYFETLDEKYFYDTNETVKILKGLLIKRCRLSIK